MDAGHDIADADAQGGRDPGAAVEQIAGNPERRADDRVEDQGRACVGRREKGRELKFAVHRLCHADQSALPFQGGQKGTDGLRVAHDVLAAAARRAPPAQKAIRLSRKCAWPYSRRVSCRFHSAGTSSSTIEATYFGLRWPVTRKPSPPISSIASCIWPAIWSAVPTKCVKPWPFGLVTTSRRVALGPAFLKVRSKVCMPLVLISGIGVSSSNFEKSMPDRNDMAARPRSRCLARMAASIFLVSSTSSALFTTVGTQVNIVLIFAGSRPRAVACASTSSR